MGYLFNISGWAALICYVAAALILLKTAHATEKVVQPSGYRIPAVIAVVCHAISIYATVVHDSELAIGFFSALSLTSLLITMVLLVISVAQSLEVLGVVLFPTAGLCAVMSVLNPTRSGAISMDLQWHILVSVMAYGVLALAATQAVALAIQTRHLRNLQPQGILAALPPINLMEKLLFQMIGAGFVLLSISLLTGALFLEDIFAQHLVHKTTLSLLGWLIFGALLSGRLLWGWRGRTALIYTLSGLGFLIVGYFGSKLVLEFILA